MILFAIILTLFIFSTNTSRAAAPVRNDGLDHITLQLKWQHQFQFAGYYAAVAQGYYREGGLAVTLREAEPDKDPVKAVLAGEAEFGVGTSELLLLRAKGEDVVALAAIFQHSPLVLLARHRDGINDLHDLAARPMMIEPQSAELFAYFRVEGMDTDKLKIVRHSFDVADLIQGKVSAMSAYSTDEPFVLQRAGVDYLTFTPRAGGVDFYGDNLFTTGAQIREHPERVSAFRAASLRGWDYALAHPAEIVELILKDYPKRKSREHLLFEAERTAQLMHPGLIEVGHMNPGRWRNIADTYAEFKMVPPGLKLGGFLYDPNPRINLAWVYWTLAGALVLVVAALGWALPIQRLNANLRREIAERRKAEAEMRAAKEAAEASDQAKSRYVAFMAHEVRAPLGGIIGMIQLIGTEPLSSDQKINLEVVQDTADNLMKLIGSTLDYSKLEEGRMELEILPVDPRGLIRDICELFRASTQAKNLELCFKVDSCVPAILMTDPTRVRQVLCNLLSNAIKFTSRGRIDVRMEAQLTNKAVLVKGNSLWRLSFHICDTGEGIAPEAQARLFNPYSQADATVSRRHGGTGLGLSISRRVAQMLGGDIRVQSAPGQGSTFTVEILAEATDAPAKADVKTSAVREPQGA